MAKGTVTVVNKYIPTDAKGTVVYIGRPSVFGNPFPIDRNNDRDRVIADFTTYMISQYARRGTFYTELEKLVARVRSGESLQLQCFCAPKPCHGDKIKGFIEIILEEDNNNG